jgi:hypothetical protein
MITETVKIDGTDISGLVERNGHTVSYNQITGSNPQYTLDGKLHDDIIAYKAEHRFKLNPMSPSQAQTVLNLLNDASGVFLTAFDERTQTDVTIFCRANPVNVESKRIIGGATYVRLSELVLTEK